MRSVFSVVLLLSVTFLFGACGGGDGLQLPVAFPPTITNVQPPGGPTTGGTVITVTGSNFTNALTSVSVGGNLCLNVNVGSATTLTCTVPGGSAGAKNVVVSTATGNATLPGGFTYFAALLAAPGKGEAPILDVLCSNEAGDVFFTLGDLLNAEDLLDGESADARFYGVEPFSALAAIADGEAEVEITEVEGYYLGLEPTLGVVFWYDDATSYGLGGFPDGWCLAPALVDTAAIEVLSR